MINIRKKTRELQDMARSGLRYGQEFVPESGPRFEKLRTALTRRSVGGLEAREGMAGLIRRAAKFLKR